MKKNNRTTTRWIFIIMLLIVSNIGFAQKITTWKGGTPGMKNDWYCPQNWSTTALPDEFSDVVIPDVSTSSFSFPIIHKGVIQINSITIMAGASLTIAKNAAVIALSNIEVLSEKRVKGEGVLVLEDEVFENKLIAGKND